MSAAPAAYLTRRYANLVMIETSQTPNLVMRDPGNEADRHPNPSPNPGTTNAKINGKN